MRHRILLLLLAAAAGLAFPLHAPAAQADFQAERASPAALRVANWAVHTGDHAGTPFMVIDKADARVFVLDGHGRLKGASAALLGLASGDVAVPGIGQRKLSSIQAHERTTPAGRFVASVGLSLRGEEILWVDYDSGVALHRVILVAKERRLERLASSLPSERRITYGCINVPGAFFERVVAPTFRGSGGVVYVLPENGSIASLCGDCEIAAQGDAPR